MKRFGRIALAAGMLAATIGCHKTTMPNFAHPGGIANQQRLAEAYDPFPETDMAPAVDGGRPMGFDNPRDSVRQVQPPYDLLPGRRRPFNRGGSGYDRY